MIRSFADPATERLFNDDICPAQWREFKSVALRKLDIIDAATSVADMLSPPGNRLERLREIEKVSGAFASTGNGEFVSIGQLRDRQMSKSWTTTEEASNGAPANASR